ncbi:hypothetical protein V8F20_000631 [Naviculisporaceae sp. PSN 640]
MLSQDFPYSYYAAPSVVTLTAYLLVRLMVAQDAVFQQLLMQPQTSPLQTVSAECRRASVLVGAAMQSAFKQSQQEENHCEKQGQLGERVPQSDERGLSKHTTPLSAMPFLNAKDCFESEREIITSDKQVCRMQPSPPHFSAHEGSPQHLAAMNTQKSIPACDPASRELPCQAKCLCNLANTQQKVQSAGMVDGGLGSMGVVGSRIRKRDTRTTPVLSAPLRSTENSNLRHLTNGMLAARSQSRSRLGVKRRKLGPGGPA